MTSPINTHYIYLLHEREFINSNKMIYKIGRSTQNNLTRFKQYPKGSILLFQMICNNCTTTENNLIHLFNTKYIKRSDIGNEYFEGDFKLMIFDIFSFINISNLPNLQTVSNNLIQINDTDNNIKEYDFYLKQFIDTFYFFIDSTNTLYYKQRINRNVFKDDYIYWCNFNGFKIKHFTFHKLSRDIKKNFPVNIQESNHKVFYIGLCRNTTIF